jgi:EmrB/QacA subfamily drug resistance transporter
LNYKWIALSNTTLGTLMASLDRNIIIIALPSIASELNASLITLVWIAIGYWVVTASVLLTFGRLADMFGRVKLYNLGFALFTIGSALCFMSQNGEQLIAFRIIQAIGAAFIFSNSVAIITDVFPETERGRALGLNQISIMIGTVLGLVLGGFLTFYFGWRSIFWINLPLGIFATIWAFIKLREMGTIQKEKIDWLGNITFSAGILFLLIGITFGPFQLLETFGVSLCISAGIFLLVIFYFIEKKQTQPMFDLSLFKIKLFTSGNIVVFLNSLARSAFTFIMVFYLQGPTMGLNPLDAGIYLIHVSIAMAIFAPISGWFYDKYRLQLITQIGLIVSAIGFLLLTGIGTTTTYAESFLPLLLLGSGMGIFTPPNRATIMSSVPSQRRGVAAGTSTTLVMMGSAFSIGIVFLLFSLVLPLNFNEYIFSGSVDGQNDDYSDFTTNELINQFLFSVRLVFFLSTIIMIISIIIIQFGIK